MDFITILKTVAPWIGTAIGGPLGGMAVEAAANALGLSDKTVDAVKSAIMGMTPEQALAMKTADQAFAIHMQEIGIKSISDLEAIAAGDRDSARKMQMTTLSFMPALLSIIVTLGFFGILFGLLIGKLDTGAAGGDALLIMLGSLGTAWTGVMAFWFGTTRQSEDKTRMLAQAPSIK